MDMSVVEYFDIIIKPEPTMQGDLKRVDRREAMKTYAIAGAIIGLVMGIAVASLGGLLSGLAGGLGALFIGLGVVAIILFPIAFAVISVLGSFVGTGIMYLIAKALGGKGTFDQHYYLSSRLIWPTFFATIGIFILTLIPAVGVLINFIWNVYSIYLQVVLIAVAHKVSKLKALVIILLPLIVVSIILMIFAATLLIGLLGANVAMIGG